MPEVDNSSLAQLLPVSESQGLPPAVVTIPLSQSAATSAVSNGLPAVQQLTSITTQMEELLSTLVACRDNGIGSGHQDSHQNFPSSLLTNAGGNTDGSFDDSSGSTTEALFSRITEQLVDLKNSAELLTSCLAAKQGANGSDSGHDDSSSLPPEVSGDTASGNMDTDVPQQQQQPPPTDAVESNDGDAVQSTSTTSQEADSFVEHVKTKAREVYSAIVRPFRTPAASNVPEFAAQGNLMSFRSLPCL